MTTPPDSTRLPAASLPALTESGAGAAVSPHSRPTDLLPASDGDSRRVAESSQGGVEPPSVSAPPPASSPTRGGRPKRRRPPRVPRHSPLSPPGPDFEIPGTVAASPPVILSGEELLSLPTVDEIEAGAPIPPGPFAATDPGAPWGRTATGRPRLAPRPRRRRASPPSPSGPVGDMHHVAREGGPVEMVMGADGVLRRASPFKRDEAMRARGADPAHVAAERAAKQAMWAETPLPLASFIHSAHQKRASKVLERELAKIPAPKVEDGVMRLDPQTYGAWLTVAKGRLAGLSDAQIASFSGIETAWVTRLVESPYFAAFEGEFRRVMNTGAAIEDIQQRIRNALPDAVETLAYYVAPAQRKPELWAANLAAAKQLMAAAGISSEVKTTKTLSARVQLGSRQVERITDAIVNQIERRGGTV